MKIFLTLLVSITLLLTTACATHHAKHPKKEDAYNASLSNVQLGFAYIKSGNAPMAKRKFMLALKENPKNEAAWYGMAYYYEVTGNETTADHFYKQAIQVNPLSGTPNNNYGTFLCRRGRLKAAIHQFLIAANNPRFINTGEAYENAGICSLLIPNHKLAALYFKKALKNNPNSGASLLGLAKIQYQKGNLERAKALYKHYQEVEKPSVNARRFAAQLYDNIQPTTLVLPAPGQLPVTN